MGNKIHLLINELDEITLDKMCCYVELPLEDGSYGVQAGHAPLLGVITGGTLKYRVDKTDEYVAVSDGVVSVMDDQVTVIVRSAERFEELDYERAVAAEERAREYLAQKGPDIVYNARMEAALRRSIDRQKLYKMFN